MRTNWLGAFAPGLRPQVLDDGLGRYVQTGTKLLFEMHYTPNGTAAEGPQLRRLQVRRPQDGEEGSRRAECRQLHVQDSARRSELRGGKSEFVFRQNTLLLTVSPHMHVRGKDFRYDLIYPDGKKETMLWVPRYDFGWQTTYRVDRAEGIAQGHEDALRGPLRQLGRQLWRTPTRRRKSAGVSRPGKK